MTHKNHHHNLYHCGVLLIAKSSGHFSHLSLTWSLCNIWHFGQPVTSRNPSPLVSMTLISFHSPVRLAIPFLIFHYSSPNSLIINILSCPWPSYYSRSWCLPKLKFHLRILYWALDLYIQLLGCCTDIPNFACLKLKSYSPTLQLASVSLLSLS